MLSKVSDLSRVPLHDLKRIFGLLRLLMLQELITDQMNETESDDESGVEIPTLGKLKITKDLDFEFLPNVDFRKDAYLASQNPETFLKRELKKILKLTDKKGEL